MERVVDDPLLTERVALERLLVAGATLLTEEVLPDCVDTLRVELLPATLRLELLPATLRLELLPATLRLVDEPATLRLEVEASPTDLDAMPDEVLLVAQSSAQYTRCAPDHAADVAFQRTLFHGQSEAFPKSARRG